MDLLISYNIENKYFYVLVFSLNVISVYVIYIRILILSISYFQSRVVIVIGQIVLYLGNRIPFMLALEFF